MTADDQYTYVYARDARRMLAGTPLTIPPDVPDSDVVKLRVTTMDRRREEAN